MDVNDLKAHLTVALRKSSIPYLGVLTTSDFTSFPLRTPCVYIVYFSAHFYSVFINKDQFGRLQAELFCSLGRNPVRHYGLKLPRVFSYRYNKYQIQHRQSSSCSLFCLFFVFTKEIDILLTIF